MLTRHTGTRDGSHLQAGDTNNETSFWVLFAIKQKAYKEYKKFALRKDLKAWQLQTWV